MIDQDAVANTNQALGDLAGNPETARTFDARAHHAGIAEGARLRRALDDGDLHRPYRLFLLGRRFALAAGQQRGKAEHADTAEPGRLGEPQPRRTRARACRTRARA